jgi:hypothetical protein
MKLLTPPGLPGDLGARCRQIQQQFSDIGELRYTDVRARPNPLIRMYRDVHPLSLLGLGGAGVAMHEGAQALWKFLCQTRDAVEAGVRARTHARPEKLHLVDFKTPVEMHQGRTTVGRAGLSRIPDDRPESAIRSCAQRRNAGEERIVQGKAATLSSSQSGKQDG